MEKFYWARFYQEDDGQRWSVDVPDLPGCFTCGESWEDALYMAGDAVRGWLETTLEDGDPLPVQRDREIVAALPVDPEMGEAKLELITVTLFDDGRRHLPDGLMADLARVSAEEGVAVNALLTQAVREFLGRRINARP